VNNQGGTRRKGDVLASVPLENEKGKKRRDRCELYEKNDASRTQSLRQYCRQAEGRSKQSR
jgi:hypothetical protein